MSYNISRYVSPALAICSFSSAGAGVVTFSFINGNFSPMISGAQIALDAGYERLQEGEDLEFHITHGHPLVEDEQPAVRYLLIPLQQVVGTAGLQDFRLT